MKMIDCYECNWNSINFEGSLRPCLRVQVNWSGRKSLWRTVVSLKASSSVSRISFSIWRSSLVERSWLANDDTSAVHHEENQRWNVDWLVASSSQGSLLFISDWTICSMARDRRISSSSSSSSSSMRSRSSFDSIIIPAGCVRYSR